MGLELKYIDVKHFSTSSMDERRSFISEITKAVNDIKNLNINDILELCTVYKEFFNDSDIFRSVLLNCNTRYLDNSQFINSLFYITKPNTGVMTTLLHDGFFRDRLDKSPALQDLFNKYCTYQMIDSVYISIDTGALKDGCGGSVKWPYMFLENMQNSLKSTPIGKGAGMIFGRSLCESILLDKRPWEERVANVLNIHEDSLKRMCESLIFKNYINEVHDYIEKTYIIGDEEIPEDLNMHLKKLKNVCNYSKLIKPKRGKDMRIYPT